MRLPFHMYAALLATMLAPACQTAETRPSQAVEFTQIPPSDKGGPEIVDAVQGRVSGARSDQRVVLFTRSFGVWWVQPGPDQPFPDQPYTAIRPDGTWQSTIQLGSEYAAAVVGLDYRPPRWVSAPPPVGGSVTAVTVVPGDASRHAVHPTVQFGGYEWLVRASPSNRGGQNTYDAANTWTDDEGALHMRISRAGERWTSSQVILNRSLGYGTYEFVIRDLSHLDAAAVLALYTLDDVGAAATDRNPREWDVEFSRWGDTTGRNARYVLQPAYLPQNTIRFDAPAGVLRHTVKWEPGRVTFTTARGSRTVMQHVATTSVPTPGNERFRVNFYDFQRGPASLAQGAEIVIEQFQFLP